jgi:hypothetical protein
VSISLKEEALEIMLLDGPRYIKTLEETAKELHRYLKLQMEIVKSGSIITDGNTKKVSFHRQWKVILTLVFHSVGMAKSQKVGRSG